MLPFNLGFKQRAEIIRQLFPRKEDVWQRGQKVQGGVPPFTTAELENAAGQIKTGKAPGPDQIPPEAIKIAVFEFPSVFLGVLNQLLRNQEFPKQWKRAKISLIWKGKPIESPSAFRPICMLDVAGKFFERMIKSRLEEEIDQKGGLSERQFGFRKGCSTIQAINKIVSAARDTTKKWFVVIALDVKNAFNSATWSGIVRELQGRGISQYLVNLVESYFFERIIQISRTTKMEMTAGVPQGSVLGPLLWNILYDRVLAVRLTEGAVSIAYADDLAVLIEADGDEELEYRVNESLREINRWMTKNDLALAPDKTEAVILKGPRDRGHLNLKIMDTRIIPGKTINYLGVYLDEKLSFGEHIRHTTGKAATKLAALTRILPNVGGPGSTRRMVLCEVVHSIILYGAPVWHEALTRLKYKNMLSGIQRRALLRIASGYRTVSTAAIQVISGIPPISLIVEERLRLYQLENAHLESVKKRERVITVQKWQDEWEDHVGTAAWTKTLIPDIISWVNCGHRRLDYYLTQFLSGHGSFKAYTRRMGITPDDDECMYCGREDTAEHTVIVCDRWHHWRSEMEAQIGMQVTTANVVDLMITSERNWEQIRGFIGKVMRCKKVEERELMLG